MHKIKQCLPGRSNFRDNHKVLVFFSLEPQVIIVYYISNKMLRHDIVAIGYGLVCMTSLKDVKNFKFIFWKWLLLLLDPRYLVVSEFTNCGMVHVGQKYFLLQFPHTNSRAQILKTLKAL